MERKDRHFTRSLVVDVFIVVTESCHERVTPTSRQEINIVVIER